MRVCDIGMNFGRCISAAAASIVVSLGLILTVVTATPVNRIAIGSCNRHNDLSGAEIFETVARLNSDVWVWLGDAVYGDIRQMVCCCFARAPLPRTEPRLLGLTCASVFFLFRNDVCCNPL